MVDYSKWDKFDYEDEDDVDDEPRANVKTIGGGSKGGRVQIGPSGYTIEDEHKEEVEAVQVVSQVASAAQKPVSTRNQLTEVNTTNGSIGNYKGADYYWSQDRYEVCLTIFLDWLEGLKKKDITLSYFSGTKELKIASKFGQVFTGNFQFAVEIVGDPDNPWDDVFDWNIVPDLVHSSDPTRTAVGVRIALKKVSPLPNALFWWKNVFIGEPHIDLTKISGRSASASNTQDEFQQAQQIFLERMRQQREQGGDSRIDIPCDEEDNEEES